MSGPVFVLGGFHTDFARNVSREGGDLFTLCSEAVLGALAATSIDPAEVEVAHLGNFTGELFRGQGHLGGFFASIDPAFDGVPASRHEAACASGSMAVLAAAADLEAGRYDLACVLGVEEMRNVPGDVAADHLGAAAWRGREGQGARYLWPHLFARVADVYAERYGLRYEHLMGIAETNFGNARRNPRAQSRQWTFGEGSFSADDTLNPVVDGRLRRHDCGQITDGAAAVMLASAAGAARWAARTGTDVARLPRILGWGHRTAPMLLEDKLAAAGPRLFPHVRGTLEDAWRRARLGGARDVDGFEVHDCFTITEYLILDHLGLHPPGEAWRMIEAGEHRLGGALPINPSGGLIGLGHPVGATGVRMVLDAYAQVTGTAGDCQVDGARRFQTLNIGGSATTVASFVVGL